jgi:regulator of sigma E protease
VPFDLWTILATKIYPAVLVVFFFGLTIFIHELGHFLMARRRGLVVERFSIGFGPKMFGWVKDGIDYRVSWLPFGGYVALPQMSPMETLEGKTEKTPVELPAASPLSKILVALAGPVMNIILAFILATVVYWFGLPQPVNPSIVGWVEPGSREEQLGIQPGDRIVAVDNHPVKTWMGVDEAVALSRSPEVKITIERGGTRTEYLLETEMNQMFGVKTINLYSRGRPYARSVFAGSPAEKAGILAGDRFLAVDNVPVSTQEQLRNLIGKRANLPTAVKVMRDGKILSLEVTPELNEAEKAGRMGVLLGDEIDYRLVRPGPTPMAQFGDTLGQMGKFLMGLIHHKETGISLKSASGPVGIVGGWWYQITRGGVLRGIWFAVFLNISLAVFNLLPIPVLDGGHIVFAAIEGISRRKLNARFVHVTTMAFAALLISFMLYVTFFDIQRFIPWPQRAAPNPTAPAETNQP